MTNVVLKVGLAVSLFTVLFCINQGSLSLIGISSINQSEVALSQLQPQQQQEEHKSGGSTLTYQSSQLGIKMKYPSSWKVLGEQTREGCLEELNFCIVTFVPVNASQVDYEDIQLYIFKTSFEKDLVHNPCRNCDTLVDSVRHYYLDELVPRKGPYSEGVEILNDSQTKIDGNRSAWQIEYKEMYTNPYEGNITYNVQVLELITKFNGSDYVISYHAPSRNDFVKYLPVIESMINSVEFVSAANRPSFLNAGAAE